MKLLLKLLLMLVILMAGIYAATPLWLPGIFARQLPPGWQLETLETGYPDFSGIRLSALRVTGDLQAAAIAITATDIRYQFQGLKIDIGSVTLDVYMQAADSSADNTPTLDDLSLPITKLTGKLPWLAVNQLRVALHPAANTEPGDTGAVQPLVLNFQALKLRPATDDNFHLSTVASIEGSPGVNGQLDVDVNTHSRKAEIRFPASINSPSWLVVSFEQADQLQNTKSQIHVAFDAELVNAEWLDGILMQASGGLLTHVTGKLDLQANFAGKEMQHIENLTLTAEDLQAESENGTLVFDLELLAQRDGEKITVTLARTAEIQYQDKAGNIESLLSSAIPELRRTSQPFAMAQLILATHSKLEIQTGPTPSLAFTGEIDLDLSSAESSVQLQATDLQVQIENLSSPDSVVAHGLARLNWTESAPFSFTTDGLELEADELSLSSAGHFQIDDQTVNFTQATSIEFLHPVIRLAGDKLSPPMTVTADELSIDAEFTSRDDGIVSTGSGTVLLGHVTPPASFADRVDLSWQDLDLLKLAGKLSTRTRGFTTEFEGETWTGFDVDITYALLSNADIDGSGMLKFDSGVDMPIKFSGNAQAGQWNITLPATTINLSQLGDLLRVAHFELPESVILTDGYIDFQGDIAIDDEISAKMTIKGREIGASMLESSAYNSSFAFNISYGSTISASGPVSIEAVALAGGIDVTDIGAELNLENMDTFGLKNLHAEVFDGRLNLGRLRFSENRIEDTTLELSHINLGRLLAFADIDGLEGTGFLDISLPVGSDQGGIYIENGRFSANGPGRLAYTKEGIAGSNIGLQALENFQFKDLSGSLNYQSDGGYQISIHLEGKNPDLYGGHPIVFNLNIGGSLPELFEAMFLTGSFEESILKRIRTDSSE